jgi:lysozyme
LVSFAFNLGSGCLQRSTLRQRLNRLDFDVENEFMKYVYAGGKKLKGLIRRRQAEANLFRS